MTPRIVFIDDERRLLQGLKRMLHPLRNQWDMTFLEGDPACLEILKTEEFDVALVDLRMPLFSGAEVLRHLHHIQPNCVRVILSGQADERLNLEALPYAHQYLNKPCNPVDLISTIERVLLCQEILPQTHWREQISRLTAIPCQSRVRLKLLSLLDRPSTSLEVVSHVILEDVCLSARMLQWVNSGFFGSPRHISSPGEAMMLLGTDVLRKLLSDTSLFPDWDAELAERFNIAALNSSSLEVAVNSQRLASLENENEQAQGEAFVAGLVHGIGRIVLAWIAPFAYAEVEHATTQENTVREEAELRLLGVDYAQVGACLLSLWGFPLTVVNAVGFRSHEDAAPDSVASAVQLASSLHHASGIDKTGEGSGPWKEYLRRTFDENRSPSMRKLFQQH